MTLIPLDPPQPGDQTAAAAGPPTLIPLDPPAPAPSAGDYAADIAKSGVAGVEHGVAGLVGMPGDIMAGTSAVNQRLTERAAPEAPTQPAGPSVAATDVGIPVMPGLRSTGEAPRPAPTTGEVMAAAKEAGVPLADYTPQTIPGEYARTIGEFAPAALGGEASLLSRAARVAVPAVTSETAGQVARQVAPNYENLVRLVAGMSSGAATAFLTNLGLDAATAARVRAAAEQGIPLTRGGATADVTQQAWEQAALHGAKGPMAQNVMQEFEQNQLAARQAALERAGPTITGPAAGAALPAGREAIPAAGQQVQEGLQTHAQNLRQSANEAYQAMEDAGATVWAGSARGLRDQADAALRQEGHDLSGLNAGAYPATRQALNVLDKVNVNPVRSVGAPPAEIPLADINEARKAINRISSNPLDRTDASALGTVKKHFDNWLVDAVDNHLMNGDPAGLREMQNATDLWARFRSLTDPRGQAGRAPSDAQRLVQKIVNGDHTPEEVGNWVMGASTVGGSSKAARVVADIRDQLGENSAAYQGIRHALYQDITNPTVGTAAQGLAAGPQALAKRMGAALNADGPRFPLVKEVFTPQEIGGMRRLQGVIQNMTPLPRATNPSRSSYGVGRLAREGLGAAGSLLGLAHGGFGHFIIGKAGGEAVKTLSDIGSALKARRAIRPLAVTPTASRVRQSLGQSLLSTGSAYGPQQ